MELLQSCTEPLIFASFDNTEMMQVIEILDVMKVKDLFVLHSRSHSADDLVMQGARASVALVLT